LTGSTAAASILPLFGQVPQLEKMLEDVKAPMMNVCEPMFQALQVD
jgi:hypothetical protein